MTSSRTWMVAALRAIVTGVPGAVVAFIQDHSPAVGFTVVAIAAAGTGLAVLVAPSPAGNWWSRTAAVWSFGAAVVAIVGVATQGDGALLRIVIGAWALGVGVLEGLAWWRLRRARDTVIARLAADHRTVMVMSLVFGLFALLVSGDDVVTVGMLGVYLVIVGVFLGIAAVSLRSAPASQSGRALDAEAPGADVAGSDVPVKDAS